MRNVGSGLTIQHARAEPLAAGEGPANCHVMDTEKLRNRAHGIAMIADREDTACIAILARAHSRKKCRARQALREALRPWTRPERGGAPQLVAHVSRPSDTA